MIRKPSMITSDNGNYSAQGTDTMIKSWLDSEKVLIFSYKAMYNKKGLTENKYLLILK